MEAEFINASEEGDCETVVRLLEIGIDVNCRAEGKTSDIVGGTALMWASLFGHTEIVHLLINAGAALDMQDEEGRTALMQAGMEYHIDIVQLLITNGANINIQDKYGHTALLSTINMHSFMGSNFTKIIRLLITNGAKLNLQDEKGDTALVLAIQRNHTEIATLLINTGAYVNHRTKEDHNVFHYAKLRCQVIIPLLLEKGATEDLD
jgi:ankyrin repeat protein